MTGPDTALLFTVCMVACLALGYYVGDKDHHWRDRK